MTLDSTTTEEPTPEFIIERFDGISAPRPARWLGAGTEGAVYTIKRNDVVVWTVGIDFGDASHVPFREELYWETIGAIVIGGGNVVYFFDAYSGELRATIPVPSYFGHLALASISTASARPEELLFLLGWTDVHRIDSRLETRWVARDVAVDGIVFCALRGGAVILSAEMDPPGGWVDVALDVNTGAELWREG